MSTEPAVIVFDGVCVLCNGWVRFLLAHDHHQQFRFAAMQSPGGRRLLVEHGLDPDDPVSFLLVDGPRAFTDTDAIRQVLARLPAPWPWLAAAMALLPRAARNRLYRWLARHRYRWFGRHATCLLPAPEDTWRFVD